MPSPFSHVQLFATLWTVACQAPLSMGFSRQEYWSGLPYPPPEDLPDPGTEPVSLMSPALVGELLTVWATQEWQLWHYRLDGPEFEQAPGVGDGQGSLACCSPWGHKGSDTTEPLNWNEHLSFLPKGAWWVLGTLSSGSFEIMLFLNITKEKRKTFPIIERTYQRTKQTFLQRRHTDG